MKPELISFKICPFVQRSVIALEEKSADYDITYIDPHDAPDWFKAISPLGKVPVLRVGDTAVFESVVILEYLDEVYPPALHPADPLRKAHNRAWIEFGSEMFMSQFQMAMAKTEDDFRKKREELRHKLEQLQSQITGPYFNGEDFSLIDAAYGPLFMRAQLLEKWHPTGLFAGLPKIAVWAEELLARDAVRNSVVEELPELYRGFIAKSGSYGATLYAR